MGTYHLSTSGNFPCDLLYVITVYFNPAKSKRRYQLHKEFHERLKDNKKVVLVTAECAFNENDFEITSPKKEPLEIQIRSQTILWIKENLINIALRKLKKDKKFLKECKYVAWVDADIEFMDVDWFPKLEMSLTKFSIVQMFKCALFLDMNENNLETHISFGYYYDTKKLQLSKGEYPHPGYAWCTTKDKILKLKEIYDMGILGSGDTHMSFALIGDYEKGFLKIFNYEEKFKKSVLKWQNRALKIFEKKLGFIDMNIRHFWHGSRDNRQQIYRWKLLMDFHFNPINDLIKLKDGHFELHPNKKNLESKLIQIFLKINEEESNQKNDDLDIPNEKTTILFSQNQKLSYSLSEKIIIFFNQHNSIK